MYIYLAFNFPPFHFQEQRDADPKVQQIHHRLQMIKLLADESVTSPQLNATIANQIVELSKDDAYFSESVILPESIQCINFMRIVRNSFESSRETIEAVTQTQTDQVFVCFF